MISETTVFMSLPLGRKWDQPGPRKTWPQMTAAVLVAADVIDGTRISLLANLVRRM